MASKRSNTTMVKEKVSLRKGMIADGTKRRASKLAIDISGITEERGRLVKKGIAVPKPPAPPVVDRKVTKTIQG